LCRRSQSFALECLFLSEHLLPRIYCKNSPIRSTKNPCLRFASGWFTLCATTDGGRGLCLVRKRVDVTCGTLRYRRKADPLMKAQLPIAGECQVFSPVASRTIFHCDAGSRVQYTKGTRKVSRNQTYRRRLTTCSSVPIARYRSMTLVTGAERRRHPLKGSARWMTPSLVRGKARQIADGKDG